MYRSEKLSDRKLIKISGNDSKSFLQGLITNDVEKLSDEQSIYACHLSPQGKYLTDMFISQSNDEIICEIPAEYKQQFIQRLKIYKLRSDVIISDISDDFEILWVDRDNSSFDLGKRVILENYDLCFIDPRSVNLGLRAYVKKTNYQILESKLTKPETLYEQKRIENKIPEGHKDLLADKSFPLEFGFDVINAIDFHKGCYVGQEVVSRTWHRGVIRKKIYLVKTDNILPSYGSLINADQVNIGYLCSSINNIGLALIREEEFLQSKTAKKKYFIDNVEITIIADI